MVGRSANQDSSKKTIFSPASGVSSFFLTVRRTRVARPDQPAHSHDARVDRKNGCARGYYRSSDPRPSGPILVRRSIQELYSLSYSVQSHIQTVFRPDYFPI